MSAIFNNKGKYIEIYFTNSIVILYLKRFSFWYWFIISTSSKTINKFAYKFVCEIVIKVILIIKFVINALMNFDSKIPKTKNK